MKRIYSISKFILPILFFSLTLISCGGGGGGSSEGGGGPPPPATITYVGLTTPASITEANSEDMIFGSLLGVEAGSGFSLTAESMDEQSPEEQGKTISYHPNVIDLPLILKNAAKNISFFDSKSKNSIVLASTITETINGNCGGTAKYTINVNDTTGAFDGTFIFTQYCEDEIVISGDTNINGTMNLATAEIVTIKFTFESLTIDDFIYKGNVFVNDAVAPQIITLDLLAKDSASDKVYWAKEYRLSITEINAIDIEIEVTGTYYDPDQGYVTVSTPEPLLVSTEDWPILGILLCLGDINTKAKLTAIDNYSYKIEADTNGDDTYDYNSGVLIWPGASLPSAWQQKASIPAPRLAMAAGEINGKIYTVGGYSGPTMPPINTLQQYDPVSDTWKTLSPMPTARAELGVAVVNGKLYAIGGMGTAMIPTSVVEEYETTTDTWKTKSPMPTARSGLGIAVLNGKIYIIGGRDPSNNPVDVVGEYDPSTDSWATKASMPTPRSSLAVSEVNGKIYAIGGIPAMPANFTDKVEEYDPSTDFWYTKANMLSAASGLASAVVSGEAYLMGGSWSGYGSPSNIVKKYNPSTDTWISKTSMPENGAYFPATAVNYKVYVIGIGDYSKVYKYDPLLDP